MVRPLAANVASRPSVVEPAIRRLQGGTRASAICEATVLPDQLVEPEAVGIEVRRAVPRRRRCRWRADGLVPLGVLDLAGVLTR